MRKQFKTPQEALRYHVSGAIERGEGVAIVGKPAYCLTNYTVQCRDVTSGKTGCFLFDIQHWKATGEFKAISPVFADLVAFYAWDRDNGNAREGMYIERENVSPAAKV